MTALFFALGGIIGCFGAVGSADTGVDAMTAYLDRFLTLAQAGELAVPALPELLWRGLRWPLAAFLLGFTALGLLGVPVLCAARGFFLSFSIASFARSYGSSGVAAAFLLLGIPGLAALPAFLLLATQSLSAARRLAGRTVAQGRRDLPYHRDYFFRCGLCAGGVCVSLLLERYLVPVLVAEAAGALMR